MGFNLRTEEVEKTTDMDILLICLKDYIDDPENPGFLFKDDIYYMIDNRKNLDSSNLVDICLYLLLRDPQDDKVLNFIRSYK